MEAAAILGLCAMLLGGGRFQTVAGEPACPPAGSAAPAVDPAAVLARALQAPGGRDGVARVAYAEAGGQGDPGLAAVVFTILNRLVDGRWGRTVDKVLNARSQFEPVLRVGGDWRRLEPVSAAQQARVDTILNLALDGRLPDLTHGARFFQNPAVVARRIRAGEVAADRVNFGGLRPSAVIGAHSFFGEIGREGGRSKGAGLGSEANAWDASIFVGDNRASTPTAEASTAQVGSSSADPAQALFVGRDGFARSGRP